MKSVIFAMFSMLFNGFRKSIIKLCTTYIKNKYYNSDVCVVWGIDKNQLAFEVITNDDIYSPSSSQCISRGILPKSKNVDKLLRKTAGESILNIYGPPKSDDNIRTIFLLVWPSVIRTVGFKGFYRFIKNWKGESFTENGYKVIQYMLLK